MKSFAIITALVITCLSAIAGGTNSITASVKLLWQPNTETDLAGYRVYRGATTGAPIEVRDAGLSTNFVWSGIAQGVTNFFTVTAYNTAGLESGPSNEVSYQLKLAPSTPSITSAIATVVQTTVFTTTTNVYIVHP